MKKITVTINHSDQEYNLFCGSYDKEAAEQLKANIEAACRGEIGALRVSNGKETFYFPKKVMMESVITVKEI